MAQQLWFLRHGEAEPHDARADDGDRLLTARGEGQAYSAGAALRALGVTFQMVFTSPKVRARDTARLAAEALAVEFAPVDHEALTSGFDRRDALELMAAARADQRLLVVGHDPDFTQTLHDLTGVRAELKKGGVAGVRILPGGAELIVLLRPRELDRIGR